MLETLQIGQHLQAKGIISKNILAPVTVNRKTDKFVFIVLNNDSQAARDKKEFKFRISDGLAVSYKNDQLTDTQKMYRKLVFA